MSHVAAFPRPSALRHIALLCALLVAVLLLTAANVHAQGLRADPLFTDLQQSNSRAFLRLLLRSVGGTGRVDWSSDNFCQWQGVVCWKTGFLANITNTDYSGVLPELTSDIKIEQVPVGILALYGNKNLHGTLPASWKNLPNLTYIDLSDTSVSGTLPTEWSQMTKLTQLLLAGTHVTGTLPVEWKTMRAMSIFNISSTSISGTLPSEWSAMTNMNYFAVSSTALSGTLPFDYGNWANLTSLVVHDTKIGGQLPWRFANFTKLQYMDLSNTQVSGTLSYTWKDLPNLEKIDLSNTGVNGTIPDTWGCMTSLSAANFKNTQLTGCLPYEWVCDRKFTNGGVGLTSSSSATCKDRSTLCSGNRGDVYFTCNIKATPPQKNAAASCLSAWAVAAAVSMQLLWWLS